MMKKSNIVYNHFGQTLDFYIPNNKPEAIFIYFHGGGLEFGAKEDCKCFLNFLLERNIAVVSANYRMYPTAHFPIFLEDSSDAVAWVFNNKDIFNDCENIFVGGSSAGGYISMMLCFNEEYLKRNNINVTDIKGFVHDSGQPTSHYNILRERGIDPKKIVVDETAPIYFVGETKSCSDMIFLVSDNDIPCRYEQTMLMLSSLKHFGYDQNKIKFKLMNGTHCEHCERDDNIFAKIIYDFIMGVIG